RRTTGIPRHAVSRADDRPGGRPAEVPRREARGPDGEAASTRRKPPIGAAAVRRPIHGLPTGLLAGALLLLPSTARGGDGPTLPAPNAQARIESIRRARV